MNNKLLVYVALGLSVIALGVAVFRGGTIVNPIREIIRSEKLGAGGCSGVSNCTAFNDLQVDRLHSAYLAEGGAQLSGQSSSTASSTVLTAAQLCNLSTFIASSTNATSTLTFPTATSTVAQAGCLATDGDFFRFYVWNNSTNSLVLATSTGDTISQAWVSSSTGANSSSSLVTGTTTVAILGNSTSSDPSAWITAIRLTSTTVRYLFEPFNLAF